tara:strand:+ start:1560 stop:2363 length:804 start_codon:yes stop_codon:yes gene_type:complete
MRGTVTLSAPSGVPVKAFMPRPYGSHQFTVSSSSTPLSHVNVASEPHFNPYFQTVEYPLVDANGHATIGDIEIGTVTTLTVAANDTSIFPNGLNILFKFGQPFRVTALELLAMPISQWKTHAYSWTQQMYFYVFTGVNGFLAVFYGVVTRCRLWQWSLVFSIAAFATVANENLYHAIVAARRGGSTEQQAYTITCVCLLANIVPGLVAMLFMRYGKCRGAAWCILAMLVGAGFLFLAGSGWFVGCGLLIAGGTIRLLQQYCNCVLVQ